MYKLFVAFRYLRRSWLNLIGVIAVAIGVLGLICVLSVMKGFDEEFRARIRATLSDLIIEDWYGEPFADYETLMAKMEKIPHVVAVAPQFDGLGLVRIGKHSQYAAFHGIDLPREVQTTEFAGYWRTWRGRAAREEIQEMIPDGAAEGLDAPEKVQALLSRMRHEDFDYLGPLQQQALRNWSQQNKFDLEGALRAGDASTPEWAAVEDARESPVFAGGEMLVVGRTMAGKNVTLDPGQQMVLITTTDIFDEGRVVKRCRVAGGFRSGLYDYDRDTLYLPLADVQQFMKKPGSVTSINVRLDSFANAPQVRAEILGLLTADEIEQGLRLIGADLKRHDLLTLRSLQDQLRVLRERGPTWFAEGDPTVVRATVEAERTLLKAMSGTLKRQAASPNTTTINELQAFQVRIAARDGGGIGYQKYRISTWEDKRRTFLRAVGLERRIMAFILFFLILIAGLLIFSNLLTTVVSKTRDIGTLKSIGGSVRGIMSIFLLNGLLIGTVGSAIGTVGGILLTRNINAIEHLLKGMLGFSLFPQEIYYLDKIPVDKDPWMSILVISLTAIVVSVMAAAYPAWKASRMDAVEALRYE